jgi:hypothetical protein
VSFWTGCIRSSFRRPGGSKLKCLCTIRILKWVGVIWYCKKVLTLKIISIHIIRNILIWIFTPVSIKIYDTRVHLWRLSDITQLQYYSNIVYPGTISTWVYRPRVARSRLRFLFRTMSARRVMSLVFLLVCSVQHTNPRAEICAFPEC